MNLALFDFDGTITNNDSFTAFIHFAAGRKRLFWGRVRLLPVILGYKIGLISAAKTREVVAGFVFKGRQLSDLNLYGHQYAQTIIPKHLNPKAMDRIKWHKNQGDQVVVVSASLDVYLNFWCEEHGLDLICSKFEVCNGMITGKYNPPDCSGEEKTLRIKNRYNLDAFQKIYAYGDTSEDMEMLNLADEKYYKWKRT